MHCSVTDLEKFYDTEIGVIVRNILQKHINEIWVDTHGLRILGCGYAIPYLDDFYHNAERVFAMMPKKQGAGHWVPRNKNLVLMSEEDRMPIENSSIDRILLIHHLEACDNLKTSLREIWRVLKGNGRLLVIVPNRMGMWAKAEWSPFGHGHPFTASQVCGYLKDSLFVQEHYKSALFVPPIPDSPVMMKSANIIERTGGRLLPFVAGVHIVEMSKQLYAKADSGGGGSAVLAKTKEILIGKTSSVPQGFFPDGQRSNKHKYKIIPAH